MNTNSASIVHPITASQNMAGAMVLALGLFVVIGAGFVQAHALHEGTHDTRHAFGLPCH